MSNSDVFDPICDPYHCEILGHKKLININLIGQPHTFLKSTNILGKFFSTLGEIYVNVLLVSFI